MADLKTWQGYASQCNGVVVAWINQTQALKGTGSDGVCNAVTLEWIEGLDSVRTRAAFYNKFVAVDAKGEFLEYSLPKEYIDRQKELQDKYILNVETLDKLLSAAQKYQKDNPNKKVESDAMFENYFKIEPTVRGGDQCKNVVTFETVDGFVEPQSTQTSVIRIHAAHDGRK